MEGNYIEFSPLHGISGVSGKSKAPRWGNLEGGFNEDDSTALSRLSASILVWYGPYKGLAISAMRAFFGELQVWRCYSIKESLENFASYFYFTITWTVGQRRCLARV